MRFDRVRAQVPLSDADYAEIRRRVLDRVRPRTHRTRWIALAAAAVVAVVVGIRPPERVTRQQPVVSRAAEPLRLRSVQALAVERTIPPPVHARRVVAKTETTTPVRIEFQTADPDVRIIWIAQ